MLFDIGGTKMRVSISSDGRTIKEPVVADTPADFDAAMVLIYKLADGIRDGQKVLAVSGCIAGTFTKDRSELFWSPHLSAWVGKPLQKTLHEMFQVPVLLENDAACAGLGEAIMGSGKGYEVVAYMTISTGVGGVKIVSGKIDRNIYGSEPGHQIIDEKGTFLEKAISGSSLEIQYGIKPKEIKDPEVWSHEAKLLGQGLHNTIVDWSPDIVVLGGSMILGNPAIPLNEVEAYLDHSLNMFPERPKIVKAKLGDFSGLYGALAMYE